MHLVMLAAGFGTRFGGLKQLAPVGPNNQAIMDYTAAAAHSCGFDDAIVVVRKEIEDEVREHIKRNWPQGFPVRYVYQPAIRGTATAVLAAREFVTGPFAVTNADDLYGKDALAMIPDHFTSDQDSIDAGARSTAHLIVAYRLANTVLGASEVKRGICDLNDKGELQRIEEHSIIVRPTGVFEASPIGRAANRVEPGSSSGRHILSGDERVSMNLWGFHQRIFDYLERASQQFGPDNDRELLLPDVVEDAIESHDETVYAVLTEARCIGITNRDDLESVRQQVMAATS